MVTGIDKISVKIESIKSVLTGCNTWEKLHFKLVGKHTLLNGIDSWHPCRKK